MAELDTLTFKCKRTVVSTKSAEPGKFCHLSVLDRLMEQNHVKIVYYYGSRADVEPGEWIKKLRDSLSSVITNFPIITGRLQKTQEGQWRVKCNDAGVRFIEAKVDGSVEDWLKSVDREKELKLVYWEEMFPRPYFWSTFYVQVTEFEQGGVAIGLSCAHLLADPISATMFFKAWADITLCGIMLNPPFFHSLPLSKANNNNPNQESFFTDLINYYKSLKGRPHPLITIKKYTTIALSFSDLMVQNCITMAQASCASSGKSCSPAFQALVALFWVCLSKIKGMKGSLLNMSLGLNMRNVLGLDQGFFRNCMVYNEVHIQLMNCENMIPEASEAVGETVRKMDGDEIKNLIKWLQCNENQDSRLMNGYDLVCTNLEGVNPYSATFMDRIEPVRVSYYVEPVVGPGKVLILPSSPGEGPLSRVVMVTLEEEVAAKLIEEDLIQRFSPIVLMKINTKN